MNRFEDCEVLSDAAKEDILRQDALFLNPVTRPRISKATLRRRRFAKRNAVLLALAADRTGTGREIARALYRELRRYAAGFRAADADARTTLLHRFMTLNGRQPISESTIRGVLAGASHT